MQPRSRAARDALAALAARGWSVAGVHDAALIERWCAAWTGSALDRAYAAAIAAHHSAPRPFEQVGVLLPGNVAIAAAQQIGEALLAGVHRVAVGVPDAQGRGRRTLTAAEDFVSALGRVDPDVAARVRIDPLPAADASSARSWLRPLQALVAAGSDAALARWRGWWDETGPGRAARWQGHRVSVALWSPAEPGGLAAHALAIAEDALIGDGAGCMSPRLLVLQPPPETDRTIVDAALDALGAACAQVGARFPARGRSTASAAAHRLHIDELALSHELRSPGAATALLVGDVPAPPAPPPQAATDALFSLGPGHRALVVWCAVDDGWLAQLRPLRPWLGTLAVAGPPGAWPARGRAAGFVRVVHAGMAQAPGPAEVQDGATPIRVFWA
jgi:hypothetical protein